MKAALNITIVQADLHWEDPEANRDMFSETFDRVEGDTDLFVLPEMFTTGFTMNAGALAEEQEGQTLQWMRQMAKHHKTAITGSVIIRDGKNYYNRLFFVFPDSSYHWYDKRHTFTLAGEHKTYTAGTDKLIVEYNGWKLCPLICYDLRFPVWARNTANYDALIYVANWPEKRISAWDALLRARAIENMSYCIGVNRVGLDGNGHQYVGHSAVYDVLGDKLTRDAFEEPFTETVRLSQEHLLDTRKKLQFLNDRDAFNLI